MTEEEESNEEDEDEEMEKEESKVGGNIKEESINLSQLTHFKALSDICFVLIFISILCVVEKEAKNGQRAVRHGDLL